MKKVFIGLFLLNSLILFSQNLEIIGGLNYNRFFEFHQDEGHYRSSYKSDWGYAFKLAIDDVKFEGQDLRFT